MPHDLYGNYYASERDAMNAEYAQMAVIDAGIAERNAREAHEQASSLEDRLRELETRVKALEALSPPAPGGNGNG